MEKFKSENDFTQIKEGLKQKSLYGLLLFAGCLGVVMVVSAFLYIWLYIQQIHNGYRLAKLHEQHELLLTVERKLKLEWTRFQDPSQMEELGRKQFGLRPPRQEQYIVIGNSVDPKQASDRSLAMVGHRKQHQ